MTACSGLKTLVATIVAIELAASWKPLVNSKIKARKITNKVNIKPNSINALGYLFEYILSEY